MVCLVDTCGWIEWLTDGVLADSFKPYLKNPAEIVTHKLENNRTKKTPRGSIQVRVNLLLRMWWIAN